MTKEELEKVAEKALHDSTEAKKAALIEYIKSNSIDTESSKWEEFMLDNDLEDRYEDEERTVTAGIELNFGKAQQFGNTGNDYKDCQYIYYVAAYVIRDNNDGTEELGMYWFVNSGRTEDVDSCDGGHDEVSAYDYDNIIEYLTK